MIVENKTIFICGAGPGLGAEVAKAALRDGANVVLAARNIDRVSALAKQLDPDGQRTLPVALDLDDEAGMADALSAAIDRFGAIDALAQVAARHAMGGLMATSSQDWEGTYATNVVGTTALIRAVTPQMQKQGSGSIILISSQAAYRPNISEIAYAASKGALMTAIFYLAQELGPSGIRVNGIVPSWMWGPALQGYVSMEAQRLGVQEQEIVDGIAGNLPLRKITEDSDVAEAVLFFASDRASMITGQSLLVNAGEFMR